jgi:putative sterol carrier protein
MSDPAYAFFRQLEHGRPEPRLGRVRGGVRFDIEDGTGVETWVVQLDRGSIRVTAGPGDAACAVRADRETFDGLVQGRLNATASLLRGAVWAEGDLGLLIYLQRLFPAETTEPVASTQAST